MPKRKREIEDSDVERSREIKNLLPENEEVLPKKKNKKYKQPSAGITDEDVVTENEESFSLLPRKKKKKQPSADVINEEVMEVKDVSSENEESFSLSSKNKNNKKRTSANEKGRNSSHLESDKEQETSKSTPTTQKKASFSKGFVLFVGQIPHKMKQKDIEKHFSTVGGVKDVRLLIYPDSQRSRGCAYVEFIDKQHLKKALQLNGSTLGHSKIKVEYPYQGSKRYGGGKNKSKGKNWKMKNE